MSPIPAGNVDTNRVQVRTWQDGYRLLAEVRDTGCGIPAANLGTIFDPFFTTKPVGVGSGLGLSIVQDIVEGFGGTVRVTSEVGHRTTFVIRTPVGEPEGDDVRGSVVTSDGS
jgi:signal transduction histidine kinase